MWPFSSGKPKKQKRRRHVELPLYSAEPLCAYVVRLEPRSFNGVRLPKKLDRVDGLHEPDRDVIRDIAPEHGGGQYRARFFLQENKAVYCGTHYFCLPGEPLIDGMPIKPKERR